MALPTLTKTYEIDPNNVGGVGSTEYEDHRRALFAIKEALVGGGSGEISTKPFLVSRSSNSSSAGASDLWTSWGSIVFNYSTFNHSWIVLKSQGSIGYELCIDCNLQAEVCERMPIYMSPSGSYTGGSTGARPTAPDEITIRDTGKFWLGNAGAANSRIHASISTDGDVVTVWAYIAGVCVLFWRIDVVIDKVTGWTDGLWVRFMGGSNSAYHMATWSYWNSTDATQLTSIGEEAGVTFRILPSYEGMGSTEVGWPLMFSVSNEWTSEWGIGAMGLWADTPGYRGKVGTATDLFWGAQARNDGDQYPAPPNPLYQFVQVGDLILPWDGATQMLIS